MNLSARLNTLTAMPSVPIKNPELFGDSRVDALIGINCIVRSLNDMRFAFEIGAPVYQDLNGQQVETDLVFTLGTQYTF